MTAWHPPWPGFSARGSLVLPLPSQAFAGLPAQFEAEGLRLERKREFHVTLLDRAAGARVHAPRPGGIVAQGLPDFFARLDWRWRASGERWLLLESKPGSTSHSLVELLDMPAYASFRAEVGARLGEALPEAPAHVTLYVAGDPVGIGVPSQAAFERLRLRRV